MGAASTVSANDDDDRRQADRRTFLRRLSGEAVAAAGTVAGTSAAVARSMSAAAEAAARELGVADETADVPAHAPRSSVPHAMASATAAGSPLTLRALSEGEEALLRAQSAVIAVNDPGGPPHLSRGPFHWDGSVARMLGRLFGARVKGVQRDSRVAILVEAPEGWLTLVGRATVVTGSAAAREAAPLLALLHPDERADEAWVLQSASGEQAAIVVHPERIVSRLG